MDPNITVIMSVLNGGQYLKDAIESILAQTYKNFEFIIIDDGSTDKTLEIIKQYANKDSRIKIIINEKNIGLANSLNKGVKIAKGKYIARQDADDISLPNRLAKQLDYLQNNLDVVLLGTAEHIINQNNKIIKESKKYNGSKLNEKIYLSNQFTHGSVMMKKQALISAGLYNPIFEPAEDYELWLRLKKIGKIDNLNQVLYQLRYHENKVSVKSILKQVALSKIIKMNNQKKLNNFEVQEKIKEIMQSKQCQTEATVFLVQEALIYNDKKAAKKFIQDLSKSKQYFRWLFYSLALILPHKILLYFINIVSCIYIEKKL